MDVSVIIVNWNSRELLIECITSIFTHTHGIEFEIIVIDSASFDGCEQVLRERYPQVRFIQSATNVGFAKANNRASREAKGECVLFLNPDTELLGPAIGTLYLQLKALPDAGAVGCRLLNSDGSVQSSCIRAMPTILNRMLDSDLLRTKWPRWRLWGAAPLYEEGTEAREVEAISGACLMVRRSTFQKIGGFSEDYFMYAEDIDLSYKLRKAGYRNYYVPVATVIHHGGGSAHQKESVFSAVMMPEATCRFLRKTRGGWYALCYRAGMCASALGRLVALGLAVPWVGSNRNALWKSSLRKWRAVLRWSVSRDQLVKQYYPSGSHRTS